MSAFEEVMEELSQIAEELEESQELKFGEEE